MIVTQAMLWKLLFTCMPLVNGEPLVAYKTMANVIEIGEWHGGPMRDDVCGPPNRDGSKDCGLAQVNSGNWAWLGLTGQTAKDPCRSVAAGARVFAATAGYNAGNPTSKAGVAYALRVSGATASPRSRAAETTPFFTTNGAGLATGEIFFGDGR